jgi:hypothetical protein
MVQDVHQQPGDAAAPLRVFLEEFARQNGIDPDGAFMPPIDDLVDRADASTDLAALLDTFSRRVRQQHRREQRRLLRRARTSHTPAADRAEQ